MVCPLRTITDNAVKFCNDSNNAGQTLITNLNSQSLPAHFADIEKDTVIPRSDYLILTETWMRDNCDPISIENFECVTRQNNRSDSETNAAGGVAIYRNLSSTSTAKILNVELSDTTRLIRNTGDVCLAEVTCFTAGTTFKMILDAVYIHTGASISNISVLLHQALFPYVYNSQYVHPIMEVDIDIPILLCGDCNTNVKNDETFIKFMKDMFNVDCASDVNNSTTLGGTTIDLTFSRRIKLETLPFISYFSYHRPILNRITQIVRN